MNGLEREPLVTSNRPLFGDGSHHRDRIINISLFSLCGILLLIAIITLLTIQFSAINLITIVVILSFVASHALLIQWYRLGDLDPKFRYLLLWNSINICVLCIVAIVYYHRNSSTK
ncbi:transmembrane protein 243-like [Oppia nitens]|uniref:transmembrane protein 243-like n=1 Tax=Oppia nitens TaxID=1686743 RepID=UPI0023D9E8DD|nr:transmembrane protein 243-like [Oppia nitens]